MIAGAGFVNVKVEAEGRFPVEAAAGDPTLQALVHESGMTTDELRSAAASLHSISVAATKPKEQ